MVYTKLVSIYVVKSTARRDDLYLAVGAFERRELVLFAARNASFVSHGVRQKNENGEGRLLESAEANVEWRDWEIPSGARRDW